MPACLSCGAKSGNSKFCPACGATLQAISAASGSASTKKESERTAIGCLSVFLIGGLLWVFGSNHQPSPAPEPPPVAKKADSPPPEPQKPDLEILSQHGSGDESSIKITGKIRNNTSKSYSYAEVTFTLYDREGNQVGTAMANINNLEPSATWKYEAIGMGNVARFKVSEITGH